MSDHSPEIFKYWKLIKKFMCGIIGYAGKDNSIPYILDGIKDLEYRGYDSFGIGIIKNNEILIKKDVGKIDEIIKKYNLLDLFSNIGIAHTRWATHGGIEQKNAHPISDCKNKIAIAHNGTVENWEELKESLKGHTFSSDTDTEVIVHLIEEELEKGISLMDSVIKIFQVLEGSSSFLILSSLTNEIVAVKKGSPLVFAIGEKGYFVSSDIPSIIKFTNKIIYLTDGDIVLFNGEKYVIKNAMNKKVDHSIKEVELKVKDVEKGKYNYYMEKEIFEEFELWGKFENYDNTILIKSAELIKNARRVYLTGSGTSFYAAMYGEMQLRTLGIDCIAVEPQELENYGNIIKNDDLFIIISQSGETYDIINALPVMKDNKKIGIINVEESTLARSVDIIIKMDAGPEKAVAATKSMVNTLIILTMLSSYIEKKDYKKDLKLLNLNKFNILVPSVEEIIENVSSRLAETNEIYYTGRGFGYVLALEGALKMKEISYIHAEAINLPSIKHGPLALISDRTNVIAIVTPESEKMAINNLEELKARGAFIIGISQKPLKQFDVFIRTVDAGIFSFAPILFILQLLSYKVSIKKGLDPDKPRNLAKSVTVQ